MIGQFKRCNQRPKLVIRNRLEITTPPGFNFQWEHKSVNNISETPPGFNLQWVHKSVNNILETPPGFNLQWVHKSVNNLSGHLQVLIVLKMPGKTTLVGLVKRGRMLTGRHPTV